jgi:diaminopimelate decarboxylase
MKRRYSSINEKNHLEFFGCDTVELAERYGTPLYVVSEDGIREKCREIKEYFMNKYPNTLALYASKAFSSIAMYKIIKEEGLGIDVVSSGELYTAVKADFPMERIYFHGNNKTEEEITFGIDNNIGCFVIDSFHEMELIQKIANEKKAKVRALLRISPGISGHTHEYISTGQLDSKFGFPIYGGVALSAVKKVNEYSNIIFKGIHCHIGSQMFNKDAYTAAVEVLTALMQEIKRTIGIDIEELNVGGGFGIYYCKDDQPLSIKEFIETIMTNIYSRCSEYNLRVPRILIEPGRWMVGENGITLYTVGSIKEIEGIRKYVSVDGGMTDNPRPALYEAGYEAVVANKMNQKPEEVVTIAGKCCESGDMLIHDIKLPKVESGDRLAVFSTGAYNYSMSSNYNRLRRPAVVMIRDRNPRVVIKRETYEDLIRNELE